MANATTQTTEETLTTIPERPGCVPEGATWLGRDDAGREHYATGPLPRGTIIVADGVELVERVPLPTHERETGTDIETRPGWMAYVAGRCGWSQRADEIDPVDLLAAKLEGEA